MTEFTLQLQSFRGGHWLLVATREDSPHEERALRSMAREMDNEDSQRGGRVKHRVVRVTTEEL